jgi:hypothetical protein
MRRFALIVTLAIFASFLFTNVAFAGGTGLNTIWTPDILNEGEFEWDLNLGVSDEQFVTFWNEDGRFLSQEFFATILPNFEMGMSFNGEREMGPFAMFAKYQIFNELEDDFPVTVAVGVDNIIGTQDRYNSEPIPYIVIGKNFNERWNGYLGFAHNASTVQDDDSVFGGLDFAWHDDWTFAVDYYGYNDNEEAIISGGLYYAWINHIALNGWVSYDTWTEDTMFTIQFAFMGRFDDLEAEV